MDRIISLILLLLINTGTELSSMKNTISKQAPMLLATKAIAVGTVDQLRTALSTGYFKQNPAHINALVENEIMVNVQRVPAHNTLLQIACYLLRYDMVEELLKNPSIDVNQPYPQDNIALAPLRLVLRRVYDESKKKHLDGRLTECKGVIRLLCERGANINYIIWVNCGRVCCHRETALHLLSQQPPSILRNDIATYLLECGGNPLLNNIQGISAYDIALKNEDPTFLTLCYKKLKQANLQLESLITHIDTIEQQPDTLSSNKGEL